MTNTSNGIVHIIDDDELMRELLADLVGSIGIPTQLFASGDTFLAKYVQQPCECIISDIRMPGISGIQLQKLLLERYSYPSPLMLVTGFAEVSTAVEAMKLGAFDFIEKPISGLEFIEKVQGALALSRTNYQRRLNQSARDARLALLTLKEREVLDKILEGSTSKTIADELSLSVRTVENHRARMMSKLHVSSAAELMREFLSPSEHAP